MSQQIDTLVQPVFCNNPTVPLVVRTVTPRADGTMLVGGAAQGGQVVSEYILLSLSSISYFYQLPSIRKLLTSSSLL
jgi:hypothetical protein